MGQCVTRVWPGAAGPGGRRPVLSYIPLYEPESGAAAAPAAPEPADPQQRALARLGEAQARLARRQEHLVTQEQGARRAAVEAWARRPEHAAADPALWAACRRAARHELYRAAQFRGSAEAVSAIEQQLVQLKVQLSTLRVTGDALSVMNEYSSHVAAELKALRASLDLDALVATIQRNADELADVHATLDEAAAGARDPADDAALEDELDLLEQEFARTSLRATVAGVGTAPAVAPPPRRAALYES